MELYKEKKDCNGCYACKDLCPKNCISVESDDEGFLYPVIDNNLCIDCGLCLRICPEEVDGSYKHISSNQTFYVSYNKSDEVLLKSTSGGAFTAISDFILNLGGSVYGASFTDDFKVVHTRATCPISRDRMRISKYVQSSLENVYKDVSCDLENDLKVLFTGTPCQTASMRARFEKSKFIDNLYLCDLICHSIPSPLIWDEYLKMLEDENGGKIEELQFRSKKYPWLRENSNKGFMYKIEGEINYKEDDRFYDLFISKNYIVRPSCYDCKFTSTNRASDITIADYWGIEEYDKSWYNPLGVSLIITNTLKGDELLNLSKEYLVYEKRDPNEAISNQKRLRGNNPPPKNRDIFWKRFKNLGLKETIKSYE